MDNNKVEAMLRSTLRCKALNREPSKFTVLNDGCVLFLYQAVSTEQQLYCYSMDEKTNNSILQQIVALPDASKGKLSTEEKLARERMRASGTGIIDYHVHKDTRQLIVPCNGNIYYGVLPANLKRRLSSIIQLRPLSTTTTTTSPRLDPKFSPDGKFVSFVRDGDVWMVSVDSGVETRLSHVHTSPTCKRTMGVADYIMQEEFDRYSGYWWSTTSTTNNDNNDTMYSILAFEVDMTNVPELTIANPSMNDATAHQHVFPRPGEANTITYVRVIRINVSSSSSSSSNVTASLLRFRTPLSHVHPWCEYVVRGHWLADGESFLLQLLDRKQQVLELHRYNVRTHMISSDDDMKDDDVAAATTMDNNNTLIRKEASDIWINVHDLIYICENNNTIIWASEESGFMHLYRIDVDTCMAYPITSGNWVVLNEKLCVNEESNHVYFIANRETPTEKHAYMANYANDGGVDDAKQLTTNGFTHECEFSSNGAYMVSSYSSLEHEPVVALYDTRKNTPKKLGILNQDFPSVQLPMFPIVTPQLLQIEHDNTTLYAMVYLPPNVKLSSSSSSKSLPLLVYVYGGPHVQLVRNAFTWKMHLRFQLLANLGFVVAMIDSRGSFNRGIAFEGHIKHRMGTVELNDQIALVDHLCNNLKLTDPKRVAITGWSYGGYMSLMALCQHPNVFKLGVAGAPVTLWEGYDTGYTERYMDTPSNNTDGYARGSVLNYVSGFPNEPNRVVICHGLIDENVHFTHTAELIQKFVEYGKPYELKIFPKERHGLRTAPSHIYFERYFINYLTTHL